MIRTLLLAVLVCFTPPSLAAAQRNKPPVPDLTAGGQPDEKHDWNLGPTGARGWMWGWKLETTDARQILITDVAKGSPADGVLQLGDVVVGVGKSPFTGDPRRAFGNAITAAEGREGRGRLRLLRVRGGVQESVTMGLPVLGDYADTAPWGCAKSQRILDRACEHIAANMKGDIDGMMNALALLATGRPEYREKVKALARQVAKPDKSLTLDGRTSGLFAWKWGYRNLFLCEYYLATKDRAVLPAITAYAETIAEGQSGVGTWGHGMAWPDLNDGRLHGSLGGYGALNQSGLVCHLSLVLAQRCGVRVNEVDQAVENANRFAAFYAGKGAIPYGDHRPGWDVHDDNGKNSLAALIFDLQGRKDEARFFAKMTVASHGERERGHTGNYFSYLWGPVGAWRAGEASASAFLKEQRWYYDLARSHDGHFPYQGGAGMSGGEHKYGSWDCTGAFVLASTFPLAKIHMTGRGRSGAFDLGTAEVKEAIAAGAGFESWNLGGSRYAAMETKELVELLGSWSSAVRSRAASALGKRKDAPVEALIGMLSSKPMEARYGACQGLGALGQSAAGAVPALIETLQGDDVWLRIQAAYALAGVGGAARPAAPDLLRLALVDDPQDPRGFTQRYLAFCLFYPGGALGKRGILSKSLDGVDRGLLLPAVERLLQNDDGRARAAVGTVYKQLTLEEIQPILPAVVEAIRTPSPSGVMFSSGIRLAGLELLARHRIREGMALCLDVTEIDKWGKQDRVRRSLKILGQYGGAAKEVLPGLRELRAGLQSHRESKNLSELIQLCSDRIDAIEAAKDVPPLRSLGDLVQRSGKAEAPTVKVFILAGQSNMVGAGAILWDEGRNSGRGSLEYLVKSVATKERFAHLVDGEGRWESRDDVWITFFERGGPLTVGFGSGPGTIGPELGFGHVVGEHFDEPVLLIKVAWGGKSIGKDFRPPSAGGEVGASYVELFQEVRSVLQTAGKRFPSLSGRKLELCGIAWHQGWNDRVNQAFNDAYEHNLACFIRDARKELELPELPFVLAETGMSGWEETHSRALSLMKAQAAVAERPEFRDSVAFVGTRDFHRPKDQSPSGQAYHWNSNAETYYLIGEGLGQAMVELMAAVGRR